MTKVAQIDDHRPHIGIHTPDGDAHVLPASLLEDVAAGRRSIDEISDRDQIVRAIVGDWLQTIK